MVRTGPQHGGEEQMLMLFLAIYSTRGKIVEQYLSMRCARYVRKNRAKYPELAALEHEGIERFPVAQSMAHRENVRRQEEIDRGWTMTTFTEVWDFMFPRNEFERRNVLSRIRERG